MALFFRVVELADGSWACRHGLMEYDRHPRLRDALEHITALARLEPPAELFVHRRDGGVERLGCVKVTGAGRGDE